MKNGNMMQFIKYMFPVFVYHHYLLATELLLYGQISCQENGRYIVPNNFPLKLDTEMRLYNVLLAPYHSAA